MSDYGTPKLNVLDDLTPGDLQVLKRETGMTLTSVQDDEMQFLQFLYVIGQKRRVDPAFTWPMSLSVPLRKIAEFCGQNWDLSVGQESDDPKAVAPAPSTNQSG